MKSKWAIAVVVMTSVAVGGCTSTKTIVGPTKTEIATVQATTPTPLSSVAAPTSTTTPPPKTTARAQPKKNVRYHSVVSLRNAAERAGYACPNWVEDDKVTNAAESGSCTDNDVFCTYASESSRDAQITQTRQNNELLKSSNLPTSVVLFGRNWSINFESAADAKQVQAVIGGDETR